MQSFSPLQPSIVTNVERAPIIFAAPGENGYAVSIPNVLEIRVRRMLNRAGKPVFATTALDQFSNAIEYAQNLTYKFWDQRGALKWDYSGRQANFRSFDLDSRDYTNQSMLIQFADGSGSLNKKQLELIESRHLTRPRQSAPSEFSEMQQKK